MFGSRTRVVAANEVVFDQADLFEGDAFTRVAGLVPSDVTPLLFFNNVVQSWTLVSGAGTSDAQVASGTLYWDVLPGLTGFYGIRFRPQGVGHWRLVLSYPAGTQTWGLDYDVLPSGLSGTGLSASFVRA